MPQRKTGKPRRHFSTKTADILKNGRLKRKYKHISRRTFGDSLWSGGVGFHSEAGNSKYENPHTNALVWGYKLENPLAKALGELSRQQNIFFLKFNVNSD